MNPITRLVFMALIPSLSPFGVIPENAQSNGFGSSAVAFRSPSGASRLLLVGAPGVYGYPGKVRGDVFVYENESTIVAGIAGESAGDLFGWSLVGIPDQDGDGVSDVIATAPQPELLSGDAGPGYVALLRSSEWTRSTFIKGEADGDLLGYSACAITTGSSNSTSDVTIVVGAPEARWKWKGNVHYASKGPGYIVLVSPADPGARRQVRGQDRGEMFGFSLVTLDDIDGDGEPEIAVGSPGANGEGHACGKVSVLSPRTGELVRKHYGTTDNTHFGTSICKLGDLDDDGIDDYAASGVTARLAGNARTGYIQVFSGASGERLFEIESPSADMNSFGFSLAGWNAAELGALIVVGAPTEQSRHLEDGGAVHFFSRKGELKSTFSMEEDLCIADRSHELCGPQYLGCTLAWYPDVDGDNLAELIVGAPDSLVGGRIMIISSESMEILSIVDEPQ
jgi:hypothetical protein